MVRYLNLHGDVTGQEAARDGSVRWEIMVGSVGVSYDV